MRPEANIDQVPQGKDRYKDNIIIKIKVSNIDQVPQGKDRDKDNIQYIKLYQNI